MGLRTLGAVASWPRPSIHWGVRAQASVVRSTALALTLAGALAACGGEDGALVTFSMTANEVAALRERAGSDGKLRGELFVARGAAGALARDPYDAGGDASDSRVFDDDELTRGFTVKIVDSGSDQVTVALVVWAEPRDAAADWVPSQDLFFASRTVDPSGGLRAYQAPMDEVLATTRRRLDCPVDVEPGPDGATLWWGGQFRGPTACVGWMAEDGPVSIVQDPIGDPDCDGAPAGADTAAACLGQGQQQCWSDVPDDPAEDVDGDGYVADHGGGRSAMVSDGACTPCDDLLSCECAPGDGEFAVPELVDVCTDDACEVTVDSERVDRRCVVSQGNGDACIAGYLDCGQDCDADGLVQVVGECIDADLKLDCGSAACDPRNTDGVRWSCERVSAGGQLCPWRSKLGTQVAALNTESTCSGVHLWGAEGLGLKVLGVPPGAGGDVVPGVLGPDDVAACASLQLEGLGAPVASDAGRRLVMLEVASDFGIASTTYLMPIWIEAAADVGGVCEPINPEAAACAEVIL